MWIVVFFIAPGPLTFDLIERGFNQRLWVWLGAVLIGTAIAGLVGQLPGCEPAPYILRFTEDRPNPLYRRICYTTVWSEVLTFSLLNAAGMAYAGATGEWRLKELYQSFYFPIAGAVLTLGDKTIAGCKADPVAEIRSLGETLARWRNRDSRPPRDRCVERAD